MFTSYDLWTENSFTKTLEYSMSNFSGNAIKSAKNKFAYNPQELVLKAMEKVKYLENNKRMRLSMQNDSARLSYHVIYENNSLE